LENPSIRPQRDVIPRNREVRLPPLPPGLEVYRPAEVLGSAVLVVEDEAAMQQQLRIDLHDLGYRPAVSSSAPEAMELLSRERVAAVQRALTEYGYGQLKSTGTVGSDTQAAIQKFERERKLPVTGQMSDRLVRELIAVTGRPIE